MAVIDTTSPRTSDSLRPYVYVWPDAPIERPWIEGPDALERHLPEALDDLARDSRWPSFFPSPICLVTTRDGDAVAVEKVVGASIVNRFPYVMALSFCKQQLSSRHHVRANFMAMLESGRSAAVQFVAPGADLDTLMSVINGLPDSVTTERIGATHLSTRPALTSAAPVFDAAYLVYEVGLVSKSSDFAGNTIFESPWQDVGSHRVYFLEIKAIQLRQDIADGRTQILWHSLPEWSPANDRGVKTAALDQLRSSGRYAKGYTPHYRFPAAGTIAFEEDTRLDGMAVKYLPPSPADQVEVDNDRARWPCFFPSSVGMITSWDETGAPNLMPCGSTTVLSRHPLIVAPCVSYAAINERYAPRRSLESIRATGRFGCGVPYANDEIVAGIRYAGNVSLRHDTEKILNAGLDVRADAWAPILTAMPVHFDCKVIGEIRLGTHIMFLGEVQRIITRKDVTAANPIVWCPWAELVANDLTGA